MNYFVVGVLIDTFVIPFCMFCFGQTYMHEHVFEMCVFCSDLTR
jgi:hypothetical protein